MKTIKVSEAAGPVLDWLVAKCEGAFDLQRRECFHNRPWFFYMRDDDEPDIVRHTYLNEYEPSTDWAHGGPIIEREGVELLCNLTATEAARFSCGANADWQAFYRNRRRTEQRSFATTPLLAAMRCYVASVMGDEVEVPEELE